MAARPERGRGERTRAFICARRSLPFSFQFPVDIRLKFACIWSSPSAQPESKRGRGGTVISLIPIESAGTEPPFLPPLPSVRPSLPPPRSLIASFEVPSSLFLPLLVVGWVLLLFHTLFRRAFYASFPSSRPVVSVSRSPPLASSSSPVRRWRGRSKEGEGKALSFQNGQLTLEGKGGKGGAKRRKGSKKDFSFMKICTSHSFSLFLGLLFALIYPTFLSFLSRQSLGAPPLSPFYFPPTNK